MKKKKTVEKKLDKIIQEKGCEGYDYCFSCKEIKPLSGHHHIPKGRSKRLRWNIENIVPLCAGCHLQHHNASDPNISHEYKKEMGRVRGISGDEWHESIEKIRRIQEPYKPTIKQLNQLYLELCQTKLTSTESSSEESYPLESL